MTETLEVWNVKPNFDEICLKLRFIKTEIRDNVFHSDYKPYNLVPFHVF